MVGQQQMLMMCMATIQTSAELEHFMKYEFVNYAPSLFDRFSMRKTVKSALTQSLNMDEHIKEGHESSITVSTEATFFMLLFGKHLPHIDLS